MFNLLVSHDFTYGVTGQNSAQGREMDESGYNIPSS